MYNTEQPHRRPANRMWSKLLYSGSRRVFVGTPGTKGARSDTSSTNTSRIHVAPFFKRGSDVIILHVVRT